jgi:protein TonB
MPPTAPHDDAPSEAATPSPSGLRAAAGRLRPLWRGLWRAFDSASRRPWAWALAGLVVGVLAFAGWRLGQPGDEAALAATGTPAADAPAAEASPGAQAPGLGLPVPDVGRTDEVVGLDPTLAARPEDQPARPDKPADMPPPDDNPELGGVEAQDAVLAAEARERWMPPRDARVLPRYPREAMRRGDEGTVRLAVTLDRSGFPRKVEVAGSSRSRALDRAAVDAVKQWRFAPARPDEPDQRSLEVPVEFTLERTTSRR